jgi:hypothetical protein
MSVPRLIAEASVYQADGRRQMIGTFVAPADGRRIVPQPWGAPSSGSGVPIFWRCDGCRQLCESASPSSCLWQCWSCQSQVPSGPPVLARRYF